MSTAGPRSGPQPDLASPRSQTSRRPSRTPGLNKQLSTVRTTQTPCTSLSIRPDLLGWHTVSSRRRDDGAAYGVEEITVNMTVRDGKITVESQSGPKGGSVELFVDDSNARLVFNGSGSDRATARLTGPELANFRTMVDAALSSLTMDDEPPAVGRNVLYSGFTPLEQVDDGFGVQLDGETLQRLDLLDESGGIAGGRRQVKCTVLGNGTAILNLAGDRPSELSR